MAGKTRIIETEGGLFMPQMKSGWLDSWHFMDPNADTMDWAWALALREDDPIKAAKFNTQQEAQEFLNRFNARIAVYWEQHYEKERRKLMGVEIKRVIK